HSWCARPALRRPGLPPRSPGRPAILPQVRDDSLPLDGLLVVDLTRVLAGPYCTRLLADMGARVIKVERPGAGDETRINVQQLEPGRTDQSSYFARVNAGKESVAVDLSSPDGLQVVLDLARHADVFIENFAPGVVGRLGCDYAAVRAVKPDVVYCSISGFGQTGPWRHKQAFAHITNAISGLMHLEQGDEAHPRASNLQAADMLAATHATAAILGALFRRARTGSGAHLDVSMLEALVASATVPFASVLNPATPPRTPHPARHPEPGDDAPARWRSHCRLPDRGRHGDLGEAGEPDASPRTGGRPALQVLRRPTPELARPPRDPRPVARWIRQRGGRPRGTGEGARALRSRAPTRGGHRLRPPRRAPVLPDPPASRPGQPPGDPHP